MKRAKLFLLIVASFVMSFSACGKKEDEVKVPDSADKLVIEDASKEDNKNENENVAENVEEPQPENNNNFPMVIFHPDEQYMSFESESVVVDELTPDAILNKMIEYKVMISDVKVVGFEEVTDNGQKAIDLTLNQAYADYLGKMGSTEEYYCLGALCNSFIDSFKVDKIKISIDGEVLQTGHNVYSNYMFKFE
ncbi:hypothetical protein [Ohessyouella blattaphilus]|uniref:GerMN domain-containing protein n=1 Tax=Ohessyouella blattaphilus TaxID=2949333 RepID=A0ABT1EDA2_9FIRM|nr:hypothetical protein [Ohessyouella blattaphilus]MCP1108655.1 hypothetical protein [Ohessyouella blattaphilus]MCR8562049.1 hypothetical protein [Ohessyouella blattaphilus]